MEDIDNVLGGRYYYSLDAVTAVATAVGQTAVALNKPELGKLIAQRCGRKGIGYIFSRRKRDEFRDCSEQTTNDYNQQYNVPIAPTTNTDLEETKSLMEQQSSNTNKILIGLGIAVIGLLGYIAIKK